MLHTFIEHLPSASHCLGHWGYGSGRKTKITALLLLTSSGDEVSMKESSQLIGKIMLKSEKGWGAMGVTRNSLYGVDMQVHTDTSQE